MLGEADQIVRLIRFVAKVISGIWGWFRKPHRNRPLSKRRLVKQGCFTFRRKHADGRELSLSLKWHRSDETGPDLVAQEVQAIPTGAALNPQETLRQDLGAMLS